MERPDLTARGLAQLSKTPEAVRPPTKTLGERIVSWTREAGCGAALEAVRVCPAHAGIDPIGRVSLRKCFRLPRARGDRP